MLSELVGDGAVPAPRRATRAEQAVNTLLGDFGLVPQLKPRLPLFTPAGGQVEPDVGFFLGAGSRVYLSGNQRIDVAVEVKVQEEAGTTDQKNEAAIRRYARVWDEFGIGTVLLHVLCPKVVKAAYIDHLEAFARQNLIGFLPIHGLTGAALRAEMSSLTSRREELSRGRLPEALALQHAPDVLAYAARLAEQQQGPRRRLVRGPKPAHRRLSVGGLPHASAVRQRLPCRPRDPCRTARARPA